MENIKLKMNKKTESQRINNNITVSSVRLIDVNGEQVGVMSTKDALQKAKSLGKDLVEISPTASPPVCKIMDFNKFKYDQKKAKRESEKKQRESRIVVKEVQLRPTTDVHDLNVKINRAKGFIEQGNHVKFVVKFRGRELAHTNMGIDVLNKVKDALGDVVVDKEPETTGRNMIMIVSPSKC